MMTIIDSQKNIDESLNVKKGKEINICYSSDKNYAKYLYLSMASVLANKAEDDEICFYILDGGLSADDKEKILELKDKTDCFILFINVDKDKFSICPMEGLKTLPITAYYRLGIPSEIQNVSKIIYLDCDIEVKTSLKDFYNTDINGYYFAAVEDISNTTHCKRLNLSMYYNSGVLLMNLDMLREKRFTENIFDWIKEHREELFLHDQDVLNLYCKDLIKTVDKKWNAQVYMIDEDYNKVAKNASVVHYISHDKCDFIYRSVKHIFNSGYTKDLLKLYFKRIFKFIYQWIFRLRNKNKTTKELCILGLKFNFKRH